MRVDTVFRRRVKPGPEPVHAPDSSSEACDVNENLRRLTRYDGEKAHNPWKFPRLGTLTGHSTWLIRRQLENGQVTVRLMTGFEAMRVIGWDVGNWRNAPGCFFEGLMTNELLKNLAGNAFFRIRVWASVDVDDGGRGHDRGGLGSLL